MIEVEKLSVNYAGKPALDQLTLNVRRNEILAVIGPANSGKTTLLNCINRMIETIPSASVSGTVKVD